MAETENEPKVVEGHCPVCRCTITSDFKDLVKKSDEYTKLEKKAQECDAIAADNADLRTKNAALTAEAEELRKEKGKPPVPVAPKKRFRFAGA